MEKQIIGRGLLAGALAGVLAFVFARIFVEPVIDRAIAYEDGVGAHEAMHHAAHEHGAEVFTRGVQANIGMGFGVLAFSVAMGALFALLVGAVYLGRRLVQRLGRWNATLVAAGSYVVTVAVVMLILPAIDETPGPVRDTAGDVIYQSFPADDLYEFRLYSLGTQVVMWATLGLVFAASVSRLLGESRRKPVSA